MESTMSNWNFPTFPYRDNANYMEGLKKLMKEDAYQSVFPEDIAPSYRFNEKEQLEHLEEFETFDVILSDRFVGIPNIGSVKMSEEAYEHIRPKIEIWAQRIVERHLPDAVYSAGRSDLPSFSLEDKDVSVEENYRGKGPTWSSDEETFAFVLCIENKKRTKKLLYGNDPSLLIWAGISYVYSDFNDNRFYDDLFKTLTL